MSLGYVVPKFNIDFPETFRFDDERRPLTDADIITTPYALLTYFAHYHHRQDVFKRSRDFGEFVGLLRELAQKRGLPSPHYDHPLLRACYSYINGSKFSVYGLAKFLHDRAKLEGLFLPDVDLTLDENEAHMRYEIRNGIRFFALNMMNRLSHEHLSLHLKRHAGDTSKSTPEKIASYYRQALKWAVLDCERRGFLKFDWQSMRFAVNFDAGSSIDYPDGRSFFVSGAFMEKMRLHTEVAYRDLNSLTNMGKRLAASISKRIGVLFRDGYPDLLDASTDIDAEFSRATMGTVDLSLNTTGDLAAKAFELSLPEYVHEQITALERGDMTDINELNATHGTELNEENIRQDLLIELAMEDISDAIQVPMPDGRPKEADRFYQNVATIRNPVFTSEPLTDDERAEVGLAMTNEEAIDIASDIQSELAVQRKKAEFTEADADDSIEVQFEISDSSASSTLESGSAPQQLHSQKRQASAPQRAPTAPASPSPGEQHKQPERGPEKQHPAAHQGAPQADLGAQATAVAAATLGITRSLLSPVANQLSAHLQGAVINRTANSIHNHTRAFETAVSKYLATNNEAAKQRHLKDTRKHLYSISKLRSRASAIGNSHPDAVAKDGPIGHALDSAEAALKAVAKANKDDPNLSKAMQLAMSIAKSIANLLKAFSRKSSAEASPA